MRRKFFSRIIAGFACFIITSSCIYTVAEANSVDTSQNNQQVNLVYNDLECEKISTNEFNNENIKDIADSAMIQVGYDSYDSLDENLVDQAVENGTLLYVDTNSTNEVQEILDDNLSTKYTYETKGVKVNGVVIYNCNGEVMGGVIGELYCTIVKQVDTNCKEIYLRTVA